MLHENQIVYHRSQEARLSLFSKEKSLEQARKRGRQIEREERQKRDRQQGEDRAIERDRETERDT